jgi:hypothetical protein
MRTVSRGELTAAQIGVLAGIRRPVVLAVVSSLPAAACQVWAGRSLLTDRPLMVD